MTNIVEQATNTLSVVTHSNLSITPQAVAYNFKEWMGVISSIASSVYVAFHVVFPRVQGFLDTRDGGWAQGAFYRLFGRPSVDKLATKP